MMARDKQRKEDIESLSKKAFIFFFILTENHPEQERTGSDDKMGVFSVKKIIEKKERR